MSKGVPANTGPPGEAAWMLPVNSAAVQVVRQRPTSVRFMHRSFTRQTVVRALLLAIVVEALYLIKESTSVMSQNQSSLATSLSKVQMGKNQSNRSSVTTPTPLKRSDPVAMLCTVGTWIPRQVPVYPSDGVCTWIAYIHVRYSPGSATIVPSPEVEGSQRAWSYFRHYMGRYNKTRFLPSMKWAHFRKTLGEGLNASQARSLNRTLVNVGMAGLSMLNVLANVKTLRSLGRALATMAGANPGMFLALGVRILGLLDRTATRRVPADVLDDLLTPLSVFVLETHLPVPDKTCVTTPLMPIVPYGVQPRPTLTFRGVKAFFSQPAIRLIQPNTTGRCVSFVSGAVQFHLSVPTSSTHNSSSSVAPTSPRGSPSRPRHVHGPGEPCHSWSVAPAHLLCQQKHVVHIADAQAWYASSEDNFFAYDTLETFVSKMRAVLIDHLESEIPTCLALYSVDLEAPRFSCQQILGRHRALAYEALAWSKTIRASPIQDVFQDSRISEASVRPPKRMSVRN